MENPIEQQWKSVAAKFGYKKFIVPFTPAQPDYVYDPLIEDGDFYKALSDYYTYFLNL